MANLKITLINEKGTKVEFNKYDNLESCQGDIRAINHILSKCGYETNLISLSDEFIIQIKRGE